MNHFSAIFTHDPYTLASIDVNCTVIDLFLIMVSFVLGLIIENWGLSYFYHFPRFQKQLIKMAVWSVVQFEFKIYENLSIEFCAKYWVNTRNILQIDTFCLWLRSLYLKCTDTKSNICNPSSVHTTRTGKANPLSPKQIIQNLVTLLSN